jgi:hypothetical protein
MAPSELWPNAVGGHFAPLRLALKILSGNDSVETTDAQDSAPLSARANVLIGHLHSLLLAMQKHSRQTGAVGRLEITGGWRTKYENCTIIPRMGGERASSVRQRYAGKICCECKAPLPPAHRRGERLCDKCGGAGKKRVYMHFMFRKGWL